MEKRDILELSFPIVRTFIILSFYRIREQLLSIVYALVSNSSEGGTINEEDVIRKQKARERRRLLGLEDESSEECN